MTTEMFPEKRVQESKVYSKLLQGLWSFKKNVAAVTYHFYTLSLLVWTVLEVMRYLIFTKRTFCIVKELMRFTQK